MLELLKNIMSLLLPLLLLLYCYYYNIIIGPQFESKKEELPCPENNFTPFFLARQIGGVHLIALKSSEISCLRLKTTKFSSK